MSEPTGRETLATAKDLTGAVTRLAAEVNRLRKYGRYNRRIIVFDIVITVLLAVTGAISVHATTTATQAKAAQIALCQSANEARAEQIGLWNYIIGIGKKPQTPQQQKTVSEFRHHLDQVFAARDCSHISPRKP